MNNPRFIDQYNKIVGAYLRDELRPNLSRYCFCGNLLNNEPGWLQKEFVYSIIDQQANGFYTPTEIWDLERIFLAKEVDEDRIVSTLYLDYEDRLYRAMERALLYLRQLHESKGEVIEGYEFRKRELQTI